ncbi:26S proteasome non-ATPase regulatory subunit 11 homolog [Vigna unguiculata]|uniref:26S proteasome regulatory subunit N6 n=1 Tax=Vigna unguiculata TaxID=3917 RepID=A0A4D6MI15_VIGUN|nr:26S proteasome non-ATPase regulatory subunit 11 homolog [Vigna unguiculata]QCE00182.1 26S proteasome regulatory subunit N6 [Vigna unguiculata]
MDSYLPATMGSLNLAEETQDPSEKISILRRVLHDPSSPSWLTLSIKELAIVYLTEQYMEGNRAVDLFSLLTHLRFFFSLIPTDQTVDVMRRVIDSVGAIPGSSDLQITICKDMVQWARAERRRFLRLRLERRLAALLEENKEYSEALALLNSGLIKELTRIDDKNLLVEIHLLESKLHFSLRRIPKAKVAIKAARTAANAVNVPLAQQGAIDLQSGILYAEEKNYNTAYRYFREAFECFSFLHKYDPREELSLKYMLLCKIMMGEAHHVPRTISCYVVPRIMTCAGSYPNDLTPDLAVMKAVADAICRGSLKLFKIVLKNYKPQLEEDPIVHGHLLFLHGVILEYKLRRLVEPFSRVEIAHVSELIELPVDDVERKLSQMILEKKLGGTLDQSGCLVIFDDPKTDALYTSTLQTISNIGKVVDSLYARSAKIIA